MLEKYLSGYDSSLLWILAHSHLSAEMNTLCCCLKRFRSLVSSPFYQASNIADSCSSQRVHRVKQLLGSSFISLQNHFNDLTNKLNKSLESVIWMPIVLFWSALKHIASQFPGTVIPHFLTFLKGISSASDSGCERIELRHVAPMSTAVLWKLKRRSCHWFSW